MCSLVNAVNHKNEKILTRVDQFPDICPICHSSIAPVFCFAYQKNSDLSQLQILFKCPKQSCDNLFISLYGYYSSASGLVFVSSFPNTEVKKEFEPIIREISINFCNIYNEAFQAEQMGLLQICGVGYRKSLEFLIKDYLIKLNPNDEENIKIKNLGKCISDDIQSGNIRDIAKRATWLGNDETHYVRKWKSKDLKDLKRLIDITVYWIEMEEKTKEAIQDMQVVKTVSTIAPYS